MGLVQKIFGTHSQHELKRINPIADKVESYREEYSKLTDEQLKAKTKEFKERLAKGETLDDILPEAYATVREAGKRVLGMEHYRVQIIGGIILHQGRIAEMRTGEGKTLVCTLPAYLNALEEKGVLVVTVNDYLAKRDAEWMGQIHNFLGLSVGIVLHDMKDDERRAAYACDITYVTNNELGFDYLRDNMAIYKEQLVLRDLHYCIIDEVDSVLIDEARTPLIISGQSGKSTKLYELCDVLARQLVKGTYHGERTKMQVMMQEEIEEDGDFIVNEKDKVVNLTEQGIHKVEQFFHIDNYADIENLEIQEFSSGEELLNYLRENPSDFFHIIFMDIYMEDLTGVETAKAIRKTDEQVKIVFITTSNEFASESYEVRAEDYLIKPFDGQRMNKIIDRFFRKNKEVKILEFPNGRKVSVNSIVYTSFSGHYVTVFMKDGENVQIRCTQKNFEKIIGPYPQLISSFKGVIVNLEQVDGIEEDRFRMKYGEFVPISRRKYGEVKKQYTDFLMRKLMEKEET